MFPLLHWGIPPYSREDHLLRKAMGTARGGLEGALDGRIFQGLIHARVRDFNQERQAPFWRPLQAESPS